MQPDNLKASGLHVPEKNDKYHLDIGRMYEFNPDDMTPDIRTTAYSNVAYITCSNRDVFIDFLEIPGVKKDGKIMVPGTRVFMSHAAAQQLAIRLAQVLEGSYKRGEMEAYSPLPQKPPARMKGEEKKPKS